MATSDWSSTYTEGGRSASASISPIPVSTGSPPDSGNSSPNSPAFAQDVSIFYHFLFKVAIDPLGSSKLILHLFAGITILFISLTFSFEV